ncbi:MAG TPA: hypothetical protein VFE98_09260 [Candidatus Bathyarchaeia archaeon]|nr:hypothetical protein [Candidatus Bathyarchaeia archaeon]
MKLFKEHPANVNNRVLEQFPEFREFRQWEGKGETIEESSASTEAVTPRKAVEVNNS